MELCRTALYVVVYMLVHVQGELQCSCFKGCGNDGTTFPGSNGEIVNVACGKPANMSSRFPRHGESGPACVAVNGRTGTVFKTQADPDTNCVQTNDGDYDAFWLVDLGRNYTVTDITVYRNKVAPHRMSGMSIFVDNQLCYSFLNRTAANIAALNALPERINITCPTPLTGRHVRFQKNGWDRNYDAGGYIINICEVQVWACKDGLYGVQCDQTCTGHCKDNDPCDNYYGTCPTECADRYYDQGCMSLCGNCSNSEMCDKVTGTCPTGCQPGFDPSDPLCKTQTSAESSPNLAGPVAGGVCGGLGVIALIVLVVKLIQRYRKRSSSETASPPQAWADQKFESGASNEPNGQAVLEEETGSAVGIQAEESGIYDTTQTPDDSDRAPYDTLFLKGKQDDASNSNTYQNVALHTSPK